MNNPIIKILHNWRYRVANSLIPDELRNGIILDIGCWYKSPDFLKRIKFNEKIGCDPASKYPFRTTNTNISTTVYTPVNKLPDGSLISVFKLNAYPFLRICSSNTYNIVTMLAVMEHIDPDKIQGVFQEIYRILKPDGRFILTTPAPKSERLLHILGFDKGHKKYYSIYEIRGLLIEAGFYSMQWDIFQLGYNQWVCAMKEV